MPFGSTTCQVESTAKDDTVTISGAFTKNPAQNGTKLEIRINLVKNPQSLAPKGGFEIHTTDGDGNLIDVCKGLTLTVDNPGKAP